MPVSVNSVTNHHKFRYDVGGQHTCLLHRSNDNDDNDNDMDNDNNLIFAAEDDNDEEVVSNNNRIIKGGSS